MRYMDDGKKNYKSITGQTPKNTININDDNSMTQETETCNCQLHL